MSLYRLEVEERRETGSRAVRRLRGRGYVPGVLYGLDREPRPLKLRRERLEALLREGHRTVELVMGGRSQAAMLKDVQYDPYGERPIHADFLRVDLSRTVTVRVPIHFVGVARGQAAGGVVEHRLTELEVECYPDRIPEEIPVSVADLDVGDVLHVGEVPLPDGVRPAVDPELPVAACVAVVVPEEEEAAPAAEEEREPEVITSKEKEKEETATGGGEER